MTVRELIQEFLTNGCDLDETVVVETHDAKVIHVTRTEILRESRLRVPGVVGLKLYREVSMASPADIAAAAREVC